MIGQPTRRAVIGGTLLVGAGLTGLSGCGGGSDALPGPGPEATPDPDTDLIRTVLAGKRELLARYAATTARFPGTSTGLAATRADHEGHVRAIAAHPLAPPGAADAPTPAPTSTPPTPGTEPTATPTPAVPEDRAAAVRALSAAERAAADERVAQCVAARDPDLAALLASVAACETAHALLVGDLAEVSS